MPWKPKTVKKLSPGFVSWKSLVKQWSLWEKHIVLESQDMGILSHAECHPFGASIWTPQQDGSFTYQFSSLSCQPPKKIANAHMTSPMLGFSLWHEKTTKTSHQIQARTTKGATVRFQKVASNWHKELIGRNEHQHRGCSYPKSWGPIKKGKNDHPFIPCHPLRVLSVVGTVDLRLVWWSSPRPDRWSNWRWLNDSAWRFSTCESVKAWRNTVTLASWEEWFFLTLRNNECLN